MSIPDATTTTPAPAVLLTAHRIRNPWVAVGLTLLVPGLGHLYDGRVRRAGAVWLLWCCATIGAFALAMALGGRAQLIAFVLIPPAILLAVAWDAARCARITVFEPRERWYTHWYVYVAVVLVSAVMVHPVSVIRSHVFDAYLVPSEAMAPTLRGGDYILAKPIREPLHRGEIVTCRLGGSLVVKRIVGLPRDTIGMSAGRLNVNGRAIDESYATAPSDEDATDDEFAWQRGFLASGLKSRGYTPTRHTWGPLVISDGQYFMLGDNRDHSLDSRYGGFVPRAAIFGIPTTVYFSRDGAALTTRWSRVGLAIQ